jgi:hypothetical protein
MDDRRIGRDHVAAVQTPASVLLERRAAGIGPNQSICIACEGGTHEDPTPIAAGQRCNCPCHRGGKS